MSVTGKRRISSLCYQDLLVGFCCCWLLLQTQPVSGQTSMPGVPIVLSSLEIKELHGGLTHPLQKNG